MVLNHETPEFIRQAKEFATAVRDTGKLHELIVAENYSHLELPETLCNPYGVLGAAVRGTTIRAAAVPQFAGTCPATASTLGSVAFWTYRKHLPLTGVSQATSSVR